MSRIGKTPILIPAGVTIQQQDDKVIVTGPKGNLTLSLPGDFTISVASNTATITARIGDSGAQHGLFRALLANAVVGVTQGWQKSVELVGHGLLARASTEI